MRRLCPPHIFSIASFTKNDAYEYNHHFLSQSKYGDIFILFKELIVTEFIRGLYNIKPNHHGGVVTIGNFDGVHLGHQALIERVKERSARLHAPALAITFEPQPAEFFKEKKVARLTRCREKFENLAATGIETILFLRFNQQLANLSAADFIKKVLVDGLAIEHIIVGDDFRFGRKREGDFAYLQLAGEQYGFTVESMPSVLVDNQRVSSTWVRQALEKGNLSQAQSLLNRAYFMVGRVVHGDKLGRQLGFPTANIYLHREVTPVQGIYVVRMHGIDKHPLPGVANIGIRPTVGGTRSLLEVYLFDFDRDIYGQTVQVEFCKKLRNEERYSNLDLLKKAIGKDVIKARQYFIERGELIK